MEAFRGSKYLGSGEAECSVFTLWSISAVMAVKFNLFCMKLILPVMLHAFQPVFNLGSRFSKFLQGSVE